LGKGEVLLANIANIPSTVLASYENSDSTNAVHVVRSGDTLSSIAKKYRTTVKAIMNANGLKNANNLKVGMRLRLYSRKKTVIADAAPSSASSNESQNEVTRYVVKKGDSLYNIAQRYGTTVQTLKVLNGLSGSNLSVGQELVLSPGISTASVKDGETKKYTVQEGDYPAMIAKKYNMDLYDFLKINGLTPSSTIFPGQEVQVAME
jgi:membrane-bound lytic murein transglycosylase D